jgi:O-antigen ligase
MTAEAAAPGGAAAAEREPPGSKRARQPIERRLAAGALALLPGALIAFFGFNGGGYFPGSVGFAALLVSMTVVLRVLVADDPFAGFSRGLAIVAALMAAFTGWVLASGLWSDAEDRTLIEFDRALLYLLLLVLMGLLARRRERVRWIVRGCAIGAFVVCAAGLVTRILPHVWPTSPGVANNRLSFPLTYWNALGIVAAIGLLLAIGLATSDRESRPARALAAAAVPVIAAALLFTFSRGAMAAALIGLVAYVGLSRQRALPAGLLAVVPPTLIALLVAYDADQLATLDPTTARGVAQGKHVALAVALCALAAAALRLALGVLDRRMEGVELPPERRRRLRLGGAGAAAAIVAVALAAGGASWIGDQYHGFVKGADLSRNADLRTRLTDPSSNGRTDHWRAALHGFSDQPVHGNGAGTYQFTWESRRRTPVTVIDAHGLYFETLSELGLVGLILLLVVILAILVTFARRATGPNRGYYAALFGAGLAWALHAGVDWDWEMPATAGWLFAAGGAALASRGRTEGTRAPQLVNGNRIAIAAAFLVLAVTPGLLMLSQARVSDAAAAFRRGDCKGATASSLKAIDYLAVRPEPYQMLGYCNLEQGRLTQAVASMRKAVEQEPASWEYHYSLAVALAEAGRDPRPELSAAARLNPREDLVRQASAAFRGRSTPAALQEAGATVRGQALESGRLTLK